MKTIGFLISHKNGEGRRALLPEHIGKIKNADKLYFETGYGEAVGVSDEEYAACGCHIVPREQALACDIITDVKLGDADYLDEINESKIMFGWAHTVQNIDFTSDMIRKSTQSLRGRRYLSTAVISSTATARSPVRPPSCRRSDTAAKCRMTRA